MRNKSVPVDIGTFLNCSLITLDMHSLGCKFLEDRVSQLVFATSGEDNSVCDIAGVSVTFVKYSVGLHT